MAVQPPDPRTFNSWQDAFQYPIPVVRKLEQQLRKSIVENRQKLRSLVGTSYRDLLATAERIVEMDEQMQRVEAYMSDIGRRCNARALDKVAENHARMRKTRQGKEADKFGVIAQTKVLQSALMVTSRLIKTNGDALRAAKLLVLGRILHKSILESIDPPALLHDLRRRLGALRKKLMAYIDRVMVTSSTEKGSMIPVLCAYALLTSSTSREVLRHFLQLRYEHLDSASTSVSVSNVTGMLDRFSTTISDSRELFPKRLAEALALLSKVPLVQDEGVSEVIELNLDIYSTWIAEDVRTFTPWTRNEHISSSEIAEALGPWTERAQECTLGRLRESLKDQVDARNLLQARYEVLSKYFEVSNTIKDANHPRAMDEVRKAFLDRLQELAETSASLPDLASMAKSEEVVAIDSHSLWSLASEELDISHGAARLRDSVLNNYYARERHMQPLIDTLDDWVARLKNFSDIIQKMRSQRWDDDLDTDVNDLPGEEPLLIVLSKRDPEILQAKLRESSTVALRRVYEGIERASKAKGRAASLIRILRELDERRREVDDRISLSESTAIHPEVLDSLHLEIAAYVTRAATERITSTFSEREVPTTLWDGVPPLPVQPTPMTFEVLISVSRTMSDTGSDLWSPAAVSTLKGMLAEKLGDWLSHHWGGDEASNELALVNGHVENGEAHGNDVRTEVSEEVRFPANPEKDRLMQELFDSLYLQWVISNSRDQAADSAHQRRAMEIKQRLDLDEPAYERLKKSASEYWKRTYLLFGLLAPRA